MALLVLLKIFLSAQKYAKILNHFLYLGAKTLVSLVLIIFSGNDLNQEL